MSNGLLYSVSWDTTTKTLSFTDKAGNLIYSCVVDTQPQPIVDDPTKPLYLKAKADGSTIKINVPSGDSFERSADGVTWESWAGGSANTVTLDTDEGIYVRASAERTNFPSSDTQSFRFIMTGAFEAYNNVNSILTPNFANLTDLTTLSADSGNRCLKRVFKNCTVLTKAPLFPATALSQVCYEGAFSGCSGLLQPPALPFTTTAINCCSSMFENCTGLTDCSGISLLPSIVEGNTDANWNGAYYRMFKGCTALTKAPVISAATLKDNACYEMFSGCTSLTQAPALPATTLAQTCYSHMFSGCTSLTQAPALPATVLAQTCYAYMFSGCTSLTQAPSLPATTLAQTCYSHMFNGCTSLTQAPSLPATTLAQTCYSYMFSGCTSLTQASALPATVLAINCYQGMFNGCAVLSEIHISATDISATNCLLNWLYGVAATGNFYCDPNTSYTVDSPSGIPQGWQRLPLT